MIGSIAQCVVDCLLRSERVVRYGTCVSPIVLSLEFSLHEFNACNRSALLRSNFITVILAFRSVRRCHKPYSHQLAALVDNFLRREQQRVVTSLT